jgi:hypothetical protein
MLAYIYEKKILHINRYRRRGDGSPYGFGAKEGAYDRRRKVRDGIILKDFDRRQNSDSYYRGPERRNGRDRRSGMDRRRGAGRRQYA